MQNRIRVRGWVGLSFCALSAVLYILALIFFARLSERASIDFVLLSVVALDAGILLYFSENPRRHILLFLFTVSYNILLLGRVFTTSVENHDNLYRITNADTPYHLFVAVSLVFLGLAAVYLAYRLGALLFRKQERKIGQPTAYKSDRLRPLVRVLALAVLIVSFGFEVYQLAVNVLFVQTNGYLASYLARPVGIPYAVRQIAALFFPAFVLFLATKPTRKQAILPILLYAVTSGLSVLTGRRNQLVRAVLLLVVYLFLRDDFRTNRNYRITKWRVLLASALGTLGVYGLQGMRAGFQTPFHDALFDFIYDQGASFTVVLKSVLYRGAFADAPLRYLFYPVEYMLNNSFVGDAILHLPQIVELQTEAFALTTYNYAHKLTFLAEPEQYLSGGGYGASFLVDGFLVGGVFGVVLIGLLIGLLLRFMPSLLTRPFPVVAFGLIVIRYLVYIPRDFALGWVADALNPLTLLLFGGVYLAAFLLDRYRERLPFLRTRLGG